MAWGDFPVSSGARAHRRYQSAAAHCLRPASGDLIAFAGLWEAEADGDACTIITTAANEAVLPLHDRMPVIVDRAYYDLWLDPRDITWLTLERVLAGPPPLLASPVGRTVSNVKNDGPECLEPEEAGLFGIFGI